MISARAALGRIKRGLTPSRLELISLHVPKTAGTSFRQALTTEYGDDLGVIYDGAVLDIPRFRAIHGHVHASSMRSVGRRAKWIMWLRDPAERLLSYYDFWRQSEPHGNPNHDEFLAADMSLRDFVAWAPIYEEFPGQYVAGLDPSDLFFVGITERYEADLARLAQLLGWKSEGVATRANVTPKRVSRVDPEVRSLVERHHAIELEWYRRFA